MHVHLPKPLHGWRAFTGEVGIIVVGVLIALGAEQVMEAIHWRNQVAEAERAMSFELGDSVGQSIERQRLDTCIERRLDDIGVVLDSAEKTGRLPPVGVVDAAPYRSWVQGSWDSTRQSQTASHFSRSKLANLGIVYGFIEQISEMVVPEQQVWARLAAVSGPGRPIGPAEVASLRGDIAQARLFHRLTTVAGIRARQVAEDAHIAFDAQVVRDDTKRPMSRYAICNPIPAPTATSYRYAPLEHTVESVSKSRLRIWG
jgi:hypothetical protein